MLKHVCASLLLFYSSQAFAADANSYHLRGNVIRVATTQTLQGAYTNVRIWLRTASPVLQDLMVRCSQQLFAECRALNSNGTPILLQGCPFIHVAQSQGETIETSWGCSGGVGQCRNAMGYLLAVSFEDSQPVATALVPFDPWTEGEAGNCTPK